MKVQVLQDDLAKALNICSRFASTRVQLPVLANILLEATKNKLRVASTNLEVSVSLSLGSKVEKEGSITVPSRIITDLISNLKPGQIDLVSEKETLEIKTQDFESSIAGINSNDFPATIKDMGASSIKFPFEDFRDSLSKVLFSVSNDETRPTLTGILLIIKDNDVIFVATDGFRLSQKKLKTVSANEEKRLIIPKNTLSELIRFPGAKEVEFSFKKSENQAIFGVSNMVMASRIIEGEFPDFERIIPKDTNFKVIADKDELLRSIKLAAVFAKDAANVVKFGIEKDYLEITAESQQFGTQKGRVDVKIEGKLIEKFIIAFNFRFLEEFLVVAEGDEVQMEFSDPNSPALFLDPKDSEYLHIIMPVRIQQ